MTETNTQVETTEQRAAGIRRAQAKAAEVRRIRQAEQLRHAQAERTQAREVTADTRRAAMVQAQRVCLRVSSGSCRPAVGLLLLEGLAAGLDRVAYDRAVDFVAGQFSADDPGEAQPWRVARSKAGDGTDAETRRARRHSRLTDRSGRIGQLRDVRAADPRVADRTIRGYGRWDGETARYAQGGSWAEVAAPGQLPARRMGNGMTPPPKAEQFAGPAGPVVQLRPVWAVSPDGVVADAAEVFAETFSPMFGATARSCRADGHRATRNARTGQLGRAQAARLFAPVLGEYPVMREDTRASGPVCAHRDIGPSSPWRVPSIPAHSPLIEIARRIRAEAHDARLRAQETAEAYRRNGWRHGVVIAADAPTEPRDGYAETRRVVGPVCPACRRMHAGSCTEVPAPA